MFAAVFEPFLKDAPLCVMTRLCLERLLRPQRLDTLFQDAAQRQYHQELLFSQVVELMTSVVLRVEPSVHAAYRKRATLLPVSDQAVYDKLRCLELGVSEALAADSAEQIAPVIDALGARRPAWLPGYRVRVIDGNHLAASERRVRELRPRWAKGLPGTALAVYEPEVDLVTQVFLTADGHAQERSLFDRVLPRVRAKDLWIADRNFCTLKFLGGIADAQASFVIRQHGNLKGRPLDERRFSGRTDTGTAYEQTLELQQDDQKWTVRRVTVVLDKPTRDGDHELHILTNLADADADAATVAQLYRQRWTIEGRFYEVTQTLECEPNTLGYPKAALFAFCLAMVASNAMALLRASLRVAHDAKAVDDLSSYYMALEVRQTYRGMMVALPPPWWEAFGELNAVQWARLLRHAADQVQPARYKKARRGPKKPRPPLIKDNSVHVSTHRLLEERRRPR